jgi:heavy metal translocating P-type ATPase
LIRLGFAAFCTMNVLAFSMALWSRDVYGEHASESTQLAEAINSLFRYATLIFALPVPLLLGGPLLAGAWQAVRRATVTADILILLGVVAAYVYSTVSVLRGAGSIYFEVGCVVLAFLTLGRWFEATSKLKMGHALDELAKLLPDSVHLVRGNRIADVPRADVHVGDIVRVLAGERCPVDGQIIAGAAEIDEQAVTGESRTISKSPGDRVFGGTLSLDGDLRIRVASPAGDEVISRIQQLVESARRTPGRYQRLADRIAFWFVPLTAVIAAGTAIYRGQTDGVGAGILAGLAVVLIACPCAFALATPMAVWTAMGRAAREQVLFRHGQSLERLARVDSIYFDKTGTLTTGEAEVAALVLADDADRREVLENATTLASASNHSFSTAIRQYTAEFASTASNTIVQTIPGKGLSAQLGSQREGDEVLLGSRRLMNENQLPIPTCINLVAHELGEEGSLVYLGFRNHVQALFVLREQLRADARSVLAACRELGLRAAVLTGDRSLRAEKLGAELGATVIAERLPHEKVAVVQSARDEGRQIAMVGDGINDAPALAAADVGIAMGCGADLSRDSASVCLLSNDLLRLPWAISLARQTVRTIRQNVFWAFAYNIGGIGLAVSGQLNPVWAGAAMVASSFFVVTNSLRLARFPAPSAIGVPTKSENRASSPSHPATPSAKPARQLQPTL